MKIVIDNRQSYIQCNKFNGKNHEGKQSTNYKYKISKQIAHMRICVYTMWSQ